MTVLVVLAILPIALLIYAYVLYPAALWLFTRGKSARAEPSMEGEWPFITITVPVYNAAGSIGATLDRLLALDYPRDRLQILVISDASTDGTDDVVAGYQSRGIELIRLPGRLGKTEAENTAVKHARGSIIVNVDATILVPRASLKPLVRAFSDPTVGVASGRDVSTGDVSAEGTGMESGYVGYEMWLRSLETRVGSIVGASGCFYGFRRAVHERPLPMELSWDFASALVAAELGYRSVSVIDAICVVPRTTALRTEFRRKARTMARGLSTLFYKRGLMDPMRFGAFALMLISHKLARWLPYLAMPVAVLALGGLAVTQSWARVLLLLIVLGTFAGVLGMRWPRERAVPKLFAFAGFVVASFTAGFLAWVDAIRDKRMPTWEPTPRETAIRASNA